MPEFHNSDTISQFSHNSEKKSPNGEIQNHKCEEKKRVKLPYYYYYVAGKRKQNCKMLTYKRKKGQNFEQKVTVPWGWV